MGIIYRNISLINIVFKYNLQFLASHISLEISQRVSCIPLSEVSALSYDIYGDSVKESCYSQVKIFLQHPQHLSMSLTTIEDSDYIHQKVINDLNFNANKLEWNQGSYRRVIGSNCKPDYS